MRNLTKTLAVVSLLAPASAQPLGIGDIKLHSALNQRLNAEIDLVVSAGEKTSNIRVRLAPPEKFDEAGVPWSYVLSQIKFDTIVQPNGSVVVKLSSQEALREPFLDFLLEVSWDKGNLYREFTVLIDPPVAYEQPVIPVIQKVEQPEQEVIQPEQEVAQDRVEDTLYTAESAIDDAEPAADDNIVVSVYGPTTKYDVLWTVAEKVRPSDDISVEQMMIAIYEANRRAFYNTNVNALKAGRTLDIPDREEILKISKKQAVKQFWQHNKAWKAKSKAKSKLKSAQAKKSVDSGDGHVESQLELVAPTESSVSDSTVVSPKLEQGKSTLVAEQSSKTADQAGIDSDASDKSVQASNLQLQARLEKMEQQVDMMQKLLVLKDKQLAALQNQNKTAEVDDKAKSTPKVQPESEKGAETAKTAQKAKPEAVVKPEPKPETVVTPKAKPETVVKPQPKPKPKPETVVKPKLAPVAEPETGFFPGTYQMFTGGFGALLLGLFGWLWWRKRKIEGQTDTESMFASSSEIRMPDSEIDLSIESLDDSSDYDVGTVGESSFLSEFTPSDFDAFESDQNEVDPISEADVYLAYGRYQQAEELMHQAIEEQPERNECKLKLLEIYYANENKEAFEKYTNELAQAGMHNDQPFWTKVLDMANEIIPDSEVLASAIPDKADFEPQMVDTEELEQQLESESQPVEHEEDESAEFEVSDQNELGTKAADLVSGEDVRAVFEVSDQNELETEAADLVSGEDETAVFEVSDQNELGTEAADLVSGEDEKAVFEVSDQNELETEAAGSESGEDESDNSGFDFDLSAFSDTDVPNVGDEEVASATDQLESVAFGSDSFSESDSASEVTDEMSAVTGNDEDVESINFDFSTETDKEEGNDASEVNLEIGNDTEESLESFDFNFDETALADSDSSAEEQIGVSDLTDMDEVETKIDLARAYIDMGDAEAAQTIAEEVIEKGNDQQKQTAQTLLDDLNLNS